MADEEGSAFQVELSFGARTLGPSTMRAPEYIGDGAYRVSYVATKVGRGRNKWICGVWLWPSGGSVPPTGSVSPMGSAGV